MDSKQPKRRATDKPNRVGRGDARRRVPAVRVLEVTACRGAPIPATVVEKSTRGVGVVAHREAAECLLDHADCCGGKTVTVRLPLGNRAYGDVQAKLVHVSEGDPGTCRAGIAFVRALLTDEEGVSVRRFLTVPATGVPR